MKIISVSLCGCVLVFFVAFSVQGSAVCANGTSLCMYLLQYMSTAVYMEIFSVSLRCFVLVCCCVFCTGQCCAQVAHHYVYNYYSTCLLLCTCESLLCLHTGQCFVQLVRHYVHNYQYITLYRQIVALCIRESALCKVQIMDIIIVHYCASHRMVHTGQYSVQINSTLLCT